MQVTGAQRSYVIFIGDLFICTFSVFMCFAQITSVQAQTATDPAAASTVQEQLFNDWRLTCGGAGLQDDQCYIMQNIQIEVTRQRLLGVVAGYLGAEAKPILHFTLPLGVYLPAGIALNIDGGSEYRAVISVCLADGCKAMLDIDDTLRDLLNVGKQLKVAFLDAGTRKQILVEVSLRGFASAYAAL